MQPLVALRPMLAGLFVPWINRSTYLDIARILRGDFEAPAEL